MKVNSDDLDKYLNILESNTFDFDLKGYEVKEAKFFRYGGSFHDTKITSESMEEFLKENQDYFKILVDEHIKKLALPYGIGTTVSPEEFHAVWRHLPSDTLIIVQLNPAP